MCDIINNDDDKNNRERDREAQDMPLFNYIIKIIIIIILA